MVRRAPIARYLVPAAVLLASVLAFALLTSAAPAHKQGHKHGHHHKHGHKHGHHHKKPSKPPKSFYGIVPLKSVDDADLAKMRSTGIKVLRSGFYWQSVQPTKDAFNFAGYDHLVRESAKYGITVLPYIYGTPDWVSKGLDGNTSCGANCQRYAPQSPEALSALTNFTSHLAARYGPGGSFWKDKDNQDVPKKPIHNWQIWNEENSTGFYLPKVDPAKFAKLLSAAVKGIHSQDSKAKIILGGVFGLPRTDTTDQQGASGPMAGSEFVRKLLKVKGAKKNFDGVAVHPYSHTMKFVKKQATLMHSTLKKSHDPGASMWITETGAASGGPVHPLNLGSEKAQAKRVTKTYKLFTKHRKDWNVKLVAWFSWEDVPDFPVANCPFCSEMGLVDANGKAKPSLHAYKRAAK